MPAPPLCEEATLHHLTPRRGFWYWVSISSCSPDSWPRPVVGRFKPTLPQVGFFVLEAPSSLYYIVLFLPVCVSCAYTVVSHSTYLFYGIMQ